MGGSALVGLEDVAKTFGKLKTNMQKKHARKALREAAKHPRKKAKENAKRLDDPKTKEKIHLNVEIQSGKTKSRNQVKVRVGVKGGAKKNGGKKQGRGLDTYYWRFLEFGTATSVAKPFLRPALLSTESQAISTFANVIRTSIKGDLK